MNTTRHLVERMNQRGISKRMLKIVLEYGKCESKNDKVVLGKKDITNLLKEVDYFRNDLLKIMDKKGLVVVVANNTLVTTYNR